MGPIGTELESGPGLELIAQRPFYEFAAVTPAPRQPVLRHPHPGLAPIERDPALVRLPLAAPGHRQPAGGLAESAILDRVRRGFVKGERESMTRPPRHRARRPVDGHPGQRGATTPARRGPGAAGTGTG